MPITGRPGFPVPVETAGGGNWSMLVAGRLWVAGFGSPALGQRSGMSFAVAVDSGRGDRVSEGDTDLDALLAGDKAAWDRFRSEEHTSELQSLMRNSYAVFCLKKKK